MRSNVPKQPRKKYQREVGNRFTLRATEPQSKVEYGCLWYSLNKTCEAIETLLDRVSCLIYASAVDAA